MKRYPTHTNRIQVIFILILFLKSYQNQCIYHIDNKMENNSTLSYLHDAPKITVVEESPLKRRRKSTVKASNKLAFSYESIDKINNRCNLNYLV